MAASESPPALHDQPDQLLVHHRHPTHANALVFRDEAGLFWRGNLQLDEQGAVVAHFCTQTNEGTAAALQPGRLAVPPLQGITLDVMFHQYPDGRYRSVTSRFWDTVSYQRSEGVDILILRATDNFEF
ncbi:T-cell leukemia/lymphoma protein 1A isoform X2 [Lissotriton helveticus]